MEIFLSILALVAGALFFYWLFFKVGKEFDDESGNAWYKRADELPKRRKTVDCEKWEKEHCVNCRFYDGHDVCTHPYQFGTVIQNTVEYCKFNERYKQ